MELADQGTRKRSRSSSGSDDGESSAGDPDRLSALPDCLLHVIMSSLNARQAVQTCVLSTRWKHLWRSVPCLDIDIIEFRTALDVDKRWDEFEDFVVNLMLHCNLAQLDSFRLDTGRGMRPPSYRCSSSEIQGWEYSGRQAAAWLRRAMKYCTPGSGHTISQHRQGLNLSPSYWRLKRLHLCHVPLDGPFMEHLSSMCRSLEDLELEYCTCEIRSIASDSLKNLVLKCCTWGGFLSRIASPTLNTLVINDGSNTGYCKPLLIISTPMVTSLSLHVGVGGFCGGISMRKMPSLDKALIYLQGLEYSLSNNLSGSKLGCGQSKLLRSVSNATSLQLLGVGTTVLRKKHAFQEFQNLRNLFLGNCDLSDDFRLLRFFLRGSPNLEKVTLRHCKFPGDSEDKQVAPKLEKTSSSGCCCGLDFLRDGNIEIQIIHKDGHACQLGNLRGTTDAVPDTAVAEDLLPHSIGVGPRRGTRHRTASVRISGPEWQQLM